MSGRGLVVVTDVRLSDVAVLNASPGTAVTFQDSTGRQMSSVVRSLELFSSPFNPNKPFAFVVEEGLTKADLPPGTEVHFHGRST